MSLVREFATHEQIDWRQAYQSESRSAFRKRLKAAIIAASKADGY
jgi:uncharacterized membrane protein YebE (DUF533 family)